jgi:hypothetical protein
LSVCKALEGERGGGVANILELDAGGVGEELGRRVEGA